MKSFGSIFLRVLCAVIVLQVRSFLRGGKIINMTIANQIMKPSHQSNAISIDLHLTGLFEEQSCTDLTVHGIGFSKAMRSHIFVRFSASYEKLLSQGIDPTTGYVMCLRDKKAGLLRDTCAIPRNWQCDGFSTCLDDECGCDQDSFKCADGLGCITIAQVCDSRPDCLDLSDENPCQDYQQCMRSLRPKVNDDNGNNLIIPNCTKNENPNEKSESDEVFELQEFFFGPDGDQARVLDNKAEKTAYQLSTTRLTECRVKNNALGFHCE